MTAEHGKHNRSELRFNHARKPN